VARVGGACSWRNLRHPSQSPWPFALPSLIGVVVARDGLSADIGDDVKGNDMTQDKLGPLFQDDREYSEYSRNELAHIVCSHALNKNFMELVNKWTERDRLPPFKNFEEVICAASKFIAYMESLPPMLDP
jgi:hypothetical protein